MKFTRFEVAQHPRPPQHELRQRAVSDSGALIGHGANAQVDREWNHRFLDVAMGRSIRLVMKRRHVPSGAIAETDPFFRPLRVDRHNVEGVPTLEDTHDAPDEGLRRAAREHYGSREG